MTEEAILAATWSRMPSTDADRVTGARVVEIELLVRAGGSTYRNYWSRVVGVFAADETEPFVFVRNLGGGRVYVDYLHPKQKWRFVAPVPPAPITVTEDDLAAALEIESREGARPTVEARAARLVELMRERL